MIMLKEENTALADLVSAVWKVPRGNKKAEVVGCDLPQATSGSWKGNVKWVVGL